MREPAAVQVERRPQRLHVVEILLPRGAQVVAQRVGKLEIRHGWPSCRSTRDDEPARRQDTPRSLPPAELRQQLELELLDPHEPLPLVREQVIDLLVQVADLQL